MLALVLALVALSTAPARADQPISALAPFEVRLDHQRELMGVAVAPDGTVYVADHKDGTVLRLSPSGALSTAVSGLDHPIGIALDPDGRLVIVESQAERVVRLEPDGALTVLINALRKPRWVTVAQDGSIYVSAHRLLGPDGSDPDEAKVIVRRSPAGAISVEATDVRRLEGVVANGHSLYAAARRVESLPNADGVIVRFPLAADGSLGAPGYFVADGFEQMPRGLALDRLGALYVTAQEVKLGGVTSRRVVAKVHPDAHMTVFASELKRPQGVALASDGSLWVADGDEGRLIRFRAPPAPTLDTVPEFTGQTAFTLAGSTDAGARVDVFLNDATIAAASVTAGADGRFTAPVTLAADATTSLEVFATGAGGDGLTSAPATASVTHDGAAPTLTFQAPPAHGYVRGAVPVSAQATDAGGVASLSLTVDGQPLAATLDPTPPAPAVTASTTWTTTTVPDGPHTLGATATDRAEQPTTATRVVIVDNTPPDTTITGGPSGATTQTSATFTFTGTDNLTPVAQLAFSWRFDGGPWSAFTSATTASFTGLAQGTAHTFEVKARDLAGNEDPTPASRSFTTRNPVPTITGFTPASGVAGTQVTVTGTNFDPSPSKNQVKFNGVAAAVLSASATSLKTVVPVGASTGPITVTTISGTATSAAAFTVALSTDFALALSPGETSVVAGDQISFVLTATGANGFSGIVALSVVNVPAGLTATVAAPPGGINAPLPLPTITAGGLVYVTLGVGASVPDGRYPFTVVGTATIDGRPVTRTVDGAVQVAPVTGTSISGRVLTVLDEPLAGVTVTMDGVGTLTDAAGNFVLAGVQPGSQRTFKVDGRTVQDPQHRYPDVTQLIDVAPDRNTRLPFITYLPALSPVETPIDPGRDTIVTDPAIPNMQVIVPRGTTITKEGQAVTALSITPVPIERAPMPLPSDWTVGQLFAVQPGGAVASQPVPIVYPNTLGAPPGTRMQLFFANHETGVWEIYGEGTVSQDGLRIIPDPGVGETQLAWGGGLIPIPPPWLLSILLTLLADPVIAQTGQASVSVVDLELPGRIPVLIERAYRSPETGFFRNVGAVNRLGPRWILRGWDDTLTVNGQTMAYVGDFGQAQFSQQADGTYVNTTPAFRGVVGTANADGTAQLRLKDGTVFLFDAFGQLAQRRDRNGNAVTVIREGGHVTEIREPAGRALRLEYDGSGRLARVRDPIDRTVTYDYDPAGFLSTVTDPAGGTTRYTYDAFGRMLTITDARGITYLTNVYDGLGRVVSQQAADGGVTTFDYFTSGTQVTEITITDPLGRLTTQRFDGQGNLTTAIDALGQTTRIFRDFATSLVDHVVDPLNRITRFTYDGAANVTSVTDPAGNTTLFEYDPTFNKVTKITNPQAAGQPLQIWRYEYDERGNLRTTLDPLGTPTTITYDGVGQPIRVTDAVDNTLQLDYDGHGNLVRVTDRLGNQSTITYDGVSRVRAQTDASGRSLTVTLDSLNRLTAMADASGTTSFTYDENSNLRLLTDARGKTTSFAYDAMDQLVSRTDALGASETLTYDLAGNIRAYRDRKGQTTTYVYDALDRMTGAQFADGTRTTRAYDSAGRLLQVVDSSAGPMSFTFDVLDRVLAETGPLGTVSYGYDVLNRRTSMALPGHAPTTYAYDPVDRLIGVAQGSQSVTIDRDVVGRRRSVGYSNGVTKDYQYDEASRLVALVWRRATAVLGDLRYEYDRAGTRTRVGGSLARTQLPDAVATAAYDDLNRQTAFGDEQMTYDANGLLTSRTGPSGSRLFTWDARDRLVSVTDGTRVASFAYDAFGRRATKIVDEIVTAFLYDGLDVASAIQGNDARVFLRSLRLDETFGFSGANGAYFSISDLLGSTVAVVDEGGAIAAEYTYGPFGETTASTPGVDNAFQFTGRENDGIADLYYYRARYYSPSLHRFLAPDPLGVFGGDPNPYRYVFDDPVNFVDPTGEFAFMPLVAGAALACASGAAMNGGASLLFGRKPFLKSAGEGCIASVAFHGAGKVIGAATRWAKGALGRTGNAIAAGGRGAGGKAAGGGGGGDVPASTPVGRRSSPGATGPDAPQPSGAGRHNPQHVNAPYQPVQNAPGSALGREYSGHAFDQMRNRGLTPTVVENAIQTGTASPGNIAGTTVIHDAVNGVTVIINNAGRVVSVY